MNNKNPNRTNLLIAGIGIITLVVVVLLLGNSGQKITNNNVQPTNNPATSSTANGDSQFSVNLDNLSAYSSLINFDTQFQASGWQTNNISEADVKKIASFYLENRFQAFQALQKGDVAAFKSLVYVAPDNAEMNNLLMAIQKARDSGAKIQITPKITYLYFYVTPTNKSTKEALASKGLSSSDYVVVAYIKEAVLVKITSVTGSIETLNFMPSKSSPSTSGFGFFSTGSLVSQNNHQVWKETFSLDCSDNSKLAFQLCP